MATLTQRQPIPRVRSLAFRLPILDVYVLGEMIGPFLFFFAAFFLFWALNIFFLAADYIINQHAPIVLVAKFVIFRMPQAIPMAFPFASLLAALLAMGRLMADSEITAMRTSGIPILRIARAPLIFGVVMFVVAWTMNEYIAPPSVDISTRSFYQIIYHTDALPVEPQLFRKDSATGVIYYVTQIAPDDKTAEDVQIYRPAHGTELSETLQAKNVTVDGNVLVLHDAVETSFDASGGFAQQKHVEGVRIGLPLGETMADFVSTTTNDPWTMNSAKLRTEVNALKAQGIGGTALGSLEINLADKLAWPFASLVGIIVAIPLALRFGKRGRMLGIGLGIIAFLVYYLLTSAMSAFGRTGTIDPYLAAWIPNALMFAAGTILFWMEER
jgi:lipopolysaccharide export system permease protein